MSWRLASTYSGRLRQKQHAPDGVGAHPLEALRGRKLGVKFRRQVVLGTYIVDFLAPEAKLVVEADGASHQWKAAQDAARDRRLAVHGMRVVRVKAWHVERARDRALRG